MIALALDSAIEQWVKKLINYRSHMQPAFYEQLPFIAVPVWEVCKFRAVQSSGTVTAAPILF